MKHKRVPSEDKNYASKVNAVQELMGWIHIKQLDPIHFKGRFIVIVEDKTGQIRVCTYREDPLNELKFCWMYQQHGENFVQRDLVSFAMLGRGSAEGHHFEGRPCGSCMDE